VAVARLIPAPDQGDARLVVLAAELFPECLVIVLAATVWEEAADAGLFEPQKGLLAVSDDVGTEYRRILGLGIGNEWMGSHGVHRSNLGFEPPVPPEATRLRVRLGRWGSVALAL
jgi:hypothetical protein